MIDMGSDSLLYQQLAGPMTVGMLSKTLGAYGSPRDRIPLNDWEKENTKIFFPCSPWKNQWDTIVLFLILYSCVVVPFRICFASEAKDFMWDFEVGIDFIFITDVFFNFNTAYQDATMWVIDRRMIAAKYLRGWFWIDAPSSIPVELIDLFQDFQGQSTGNLTFVKLFRMFRLLRMLKVQAMID